MRRATCDVGVGCQRSGTAGVHRTARLTAVSTAENCYVVVKQRRVFQTVCTGYCSRVGYNNRVGHIISTVAYRNRTNKVFQHTDIRQIAAGIICNISVAVVVRIYRCTVEQALAWAAARTVAWYCAGGVNIVATIR